MQVELSKQEAEILLNILQRQVRKTEWVLENRDVENQDSLVDRISVMKVVITQLENLVK